MSISRRKDGRWCVKYKIDTPTGQKWAQRSFPKDKEDEARAFDAEARYDEPENSRPTLLECVLAYVKEVPLADHTSRRYEWLVMGCDLKNGSHTTGPAEFLANKFADSLDKRDLLAFRDNYRARGVSDASVVVAEGQLRAALSWCAGEDLIPDSPWRKYRILKAGHKSRQGTLEDFQLIYAELSEWMQWACRTAMGLCLRPGMSELFGLKWSAFSWSERAARVQMGKTGAVKTVYPPEQYLAEAWGRFDAAGRDASLHVCLNRDGRPVTVSAYKFAWSKACCRAGKKMPMYAIRHIAASEMLAGGADLAAVAAQLGHRDMTTTGHYYAHAMPAAQRAAAKALPDCTAFGADGADGAKTKGKA